MNMIGTNHRLATALSALALLTSAALLGGAASAGEDVLYVGDVGAPQETTDDTIKRFDARTGAYLGVLVPPSGTLLIGPTGLVVRGQDLYVANQNTYQPFPGDILRYSAVTGAWCSGSSRRRSSARTIPTRLSRRAAWSYERQQSVRGQLQAGNGWHRLGES